MWNAYAQREGHRLAGKGVPMAWAVEDEQLNERVLVKYLRQIKDLRARVGELEARIAELERAAQEREG